MIPIVFVLETSVRQTMLNSQEFQAHRWRRTGLRRGQIVPTHRTYEDRLIRLIRRKDPYLDHIDLGQTFKHLPDCDNRIGHQLCCKQFRSSPDGQIAVPRVNVAGMPFDLQSERRPPKRQSIIG